MLRYVFSNNGSGRPYYRGELVNYRTKDNACAVLDGTQVVFASETERFTKVKHDFRKPVWPFEAFTEYARDNDFLDQLEHVSKDLILSNHHENHIYEAFYQSGFKDAAVIVNDGMGNLLDSVTLAYMREGNVPVILRKFSSRTSLCNIYAIASSYIFQNDNCEGKLMGLAGYGEDCGQEFISWNSQKEDVEIKPQLLREHLRSIFREIGEQQFDPMKAKDVAFTVQKNFEETIVEILKYFRSLLEE